MGLSFEPTDQTYADYIAVRDPEDPHFVTYELSLRHRLDGDADEDTGIPFSAMPHSLTVRGPRGDAAHHRTIASEVFTHLRDLGYAPMYLVHDLDEVIDCHAPEDEG